MPRGYIYTPDAETSVLPAWSTWEPLHPDFADDEYRSALGEVAPGRQIMNERAVELRQAVEVELLEGLVGAEARAAHAERELLLLAPRDLVSGRGRVTLASRASQSYNSLQQSTDI